MYAEGTGDEEPYCADSCAAGTCGDGQACILEQVQCIRAPCPPFAVCADTPTPAPVTEPPTAGGGEYMGCYKDTKEDRVLANPLVSTAMTTDVSVRIVVETPTGKKEARWYELGKLSRSTAR